MPHCGRASRFQVRLEAPPVAGARADGRDCCGAHLPELVHELALWARERDRSDTRVVVYAVKDGQRTNEPGPFDGLALGAISI